MNIEDLRKAEIIRQLKNKINEFRIEAESWARYAEGKPDTSEETQNAKEKNTYAWGKFEGTNEAIKIVNEVYE